MIYTNNIYKVKRENYDEIWAITRSFKPNNKIDGQLQLLSPSPELFKIYLDLKKYKVWDKETFEEMYKPKFLKEMNNKEVYKILNELCRHDRLGRKVCLVCYCSDYSLCHRSLIIDLLRELGCEIGECL